MRKHLLLVLLACARVGAEETAAPPPLRSPCDLAFRPDGQQLAVSDFTARVVVLVEVAASKVVSQIPVEGRPAGLAWYPDGSRLLVAEHGASAVAEIDPASGKAVRRLKVGLRPSGLALVPERRLLLVANSESNSVSAVDLESGTEKARIGVLREPLFLAVTPSLALVGNLLPEERPGDMGQAAAVSLIDLEKLVRIEDVRLPPGSTNVRQLAVGPGGRWAYVAHTVGRTMVPTTQLERGWVNTNALSVIDLEGRKHHATVLLDHLMEGAADPWGLAASRDGRELWISLAGVHQVARVNLAGLHELMEGKLPDNHRLAQATPGTESIWLRIKRDPKERADLVNDLAALASADLIRRTPLGGKGPRGIDLAGDGKTLAVALYYSGAVVLLEAETGKVKGRIELEPHREPDLARTGEAIFHDATYCFQHWLSCSTCHPNARVDGMSWDLLNDGMGNPKNTRSLLWSHKTPPTMSLGVRETMEEATKAGFVHIQFHQPEEATLRAVEAYLRSLEPEPSPHRVAGGELSPAARKGQALFESPETGCSKCHPAPLYTDLKTYDVGTRGALDRTAEFDTPTIIELYRTGPYLHDGSAATLREVLVDRNAKDQHGKTSNLSPEDIEALIAYMLSL